MDINKFYLETGSHLLESPTTKITGRQFFCLLYREEDTSWGQALMAIALASEAVVGLPVPWLLFTGAHLSLDLLDLTRVVSSSSVSPSAHTSSPCIAIK